LRPTGREEVRAALIDAAATRLARDGSLSVRTVAADAGVNHGLVHRHFGSKAGLRRAVLEQLAEDMDARLEDVDAKDLQTLRLAAFEAVRSDDRYWRILARALLSGESPEELQGTFPVVRRLIVASRAAGVEDAEAEVAQGLAAGLGWLVFAPWIRAATGVLGDPI